MIDGPATTRPAVVNGAEWIPPELVVIPAMALANIAFTALLQHLEPRWFDALASAAAGALIGEAGWLAAWGAIGPGRWWLRTAGTVAFSLLLTGAVVLVAPAPGRDPALGENWQLVLLRIVPVWVLCMQVPVSAVKIALRLQILHDWREIEPRRNLRQFGILDLLILTGIAAASVAAAGLAIVPLAWVAVPIQLVILPSLAAGLVVRNAAMGTLWLLCYFTILSAVVAAALCIIFPDREFPAETLDTLSAMAGFTLTMHGSVMVTRALGLHLRRART